MGDSLIWTERVRWKDCDIQGVLNNAVYLTLFEQARFGYFHRLGVLRGDSFPFLLGSTSVRFEAPGRAGMELAVRARVTRLGGKSFDMDYDVGCGEQRLARGDATLIWVDADLRSVRIPDEVRARIAELEDIPEQA